MYSLIKTIRDITPNKHIQNYISMKFGFDLGTDLDIFENTNIRLFYEYRNRQFSTDANLFIAIYVHFL